MDYVDFKPAKLSELENFDGKHVIILVSNGQTKVADLPDHGVVEVVSHAGKVTFIEQKIKEKF
ncbi:hypothetical protein IUT36_002394 [Enterococcus faecalis]|nr:hypothetical protein [Enterococcus faecalis]